MFNFSLNTPPLQLQGEHLNSNTNIFSPIIQQGVFGNSIGKVPSTNQYPPFIGTGSLISNNSSTFLGNGPFSQLNHQPQQTQLNSLLISSRGKICQNLLYQNEIDKNEKIVTVPIRGVTTANSIGVNTNRNQLIQTLQTGQNDNKQELVKQYYGLPSENIEDVLTDKIKKLEKLVKEQDILIVKQREEISSINLRYMDLLKAQRQSYGLFMQNPAVSTENSLFSNLNKNNGINNSLNLSSSNSCIGAGLFGGPPIQIPSTHHQSSYFNSLFSNKGIVTGSPSDKPILKSTGIFFESNPPFSINKNDIPLYSGGTYQIPYTVTVTGNFEYPSNSFFNSITAIEFYSRKSVEELRNEDYIIKKKKIAALNLTNINGIIRNTDRINNSISTGLFNPQQPTEK